MTDLTGAGASARFRGLGDSLSEPARDSATDTYFLMASPDMANGSRYGAGMKTARIAAASAALLVIAGCGGSGGKEPAKTFTASGTFTLKQVSLGDTPNDPCGGTGGFSDIQEGVAVVVRNSNGKKVALGQLGPGVRDELTLTSDTSDSGYCVFPVEVTDIPAKGTIFSIEISHRGEIAFKKADADKLDLTLG